MKKDLMPSHHLVMAAAWGYRLEVYRTFILSLRTTAQFVGDVKILTPTNRTLPEAITLCKAWHVDLVDLATLGYKPGVVPASMMGERFNMYHVLCTAATYRWCLAADFRDVFFQADPFAATVVGSASLAAGPDHGFTPLRGHHDGRPELLLPLEERVIGTCPINGMMTRRCFGRAALAAMANRTVVCSGVLLGTPAAYAALRIIASLVHRCPLDKMSDQAALNFALYLPRLASFTHRDGWPSQGLERQPSTNR